MSNGLTDKQKAFIAHYVQSLNATQAARKAGYKSDDAITLASIGYENLRKPHIREEISRILAENTMQPEEIAARWDKLGRGDLADFQELKTKEDLANHPFSFVVKKVEFDELGNITKLELEDRYKALDNLAKLHQMINDKLELSVDDKLETLLNKLVAHE